MRRLLSLALLTLVAIPAPCQRTVRTLTTSGEVHQDAVISPDGNHVAFKGPNKIGVVAISGGAEVPLAVGSMLGSFVWEPNSTGLYYLDGTSLRFVARSGGSPQVLATLAGANHQLWCVNNLNKLIWGSRQDIVTGNYTIFSIGTNGASFVDIVTSLAVVDAVRLNPANTKILFRQYSPQPFTPREYFVADPDGKNVSSLSGTPLAGQPEDADWVNDTSVVMSIQSLVTSTLQVARLEPGPTFFMLTELPMQRRRTTVNATNSWIALEEITTTGPRPALLPLDGGGIVPMDFTQRFVFTGRPTLDRAARTMAFSGTIVGVAGLAQVHVADLVRELRIVPQVTVAGVLHIDLPVAAGEQGVALLSPALLPQLFLLPGFAHGLALDPTILVQLLSGVGSGTGPLSVTIPLPNDPSMRGAMLFVQGVRIKSFAPLDADFTRHAEFRIF